MLRARRPALIALLALTGCGQLGLPGDGSPLTGLDSTLELVPMQPAWRRVFDVGDFLLEKPKELASPGYDAIGNRLAVGPGDGWFYLLRASDGHIIWRVEINGSAGRPVFDNGKIITGTANGELIAFELRTGDRAWTQRVKGAVNMAPLLAGELAYFVDGSNAIYAVDRRTGEWRWQHRRDRPDDFALLGESGPTLADGRIHVGFSDGYLVTLDALTGARLWDRDLSPEHDKFEDADATPAVINGTLFAASAAAGLYALDPKSGDVRWNLPLSGIVRLAPHQNDLVLSLDRGALMRVSAQTGRLRWQSRFMRKHGSPSEAEFVAGLAAVTLTRGPLYLLSAQTGRPVQHFEPGPGIHGMPEVGADGSVFVLSNGGVLYALRPGGRRNPNPG